MKNFILLIFTSVVIISSCKKDDNTPISSSDTTKDSSTINPLVFISLFAEKDTIKVNTNTKVIAIATGDELTYTWTSTGTLIGSGSWVYFTICHSGKFNVKCTVKDKYNNSETKEIYIVAI